MTDLVWIRTCQECGRITTRFTKPWGQMTDSYANAKCRKCKSEALDYGTYIDSEKDLPK